MPRPTNNQDLPAAYFQCLRYFHNREQYTGMRFTHYEVLKCSQSHSPIAHPQPMRRAPEKKKSFCVILNLNDIEYDNPFLKQEFETKGSLENLVKIYSENGMSALNELLNNDHLPISGDIS